MRKRKTESKSDWARVNAVQEGEPIFYTPDDGLYDPNDFSDRGLSLHCDCEAPRTRS